MGSYDGRVYAIRTTSLGLADSPWPKFRADNQNTGRYTYEPSSVDESKETQLPKKYQLHPNYPNPFNPVTTIRYELPKNNQVVFKVFDIVGRELAVLINMHQEAGYHSIQWDASDYPSGMYIVSMRAGSYYKNMKMILLR